MNILVTHKAVDVATYKMLGELSKNESYTIYLTVPSASEAAKVEGKCIPCQFLLLHLNFPESHQDASQICKAI